MATINRVYETMPGFDQPNAVTGPTQNSTMPFAGAGGSQPQVSTAPAYMGVGTNPTLSSFFPTGDFSGYQIANSLLEPARSRSEYDLGTAAFGQLSSYLSPAISAAHDIPLSQLYPANAFRNFGTNSIGLNIGIDSDLANKQAEVGTVAYYNKVYNDLVPLSPDRITNAVNVLNSLGRSQNALSILNERDRYNVYRESGWTNPSGVRPPSEPAYRPSNRTLDSTYTSTLSYQDPDEAYRASIPQRYASQVTVTQTPIAGWNRENVNLFGGYGIPNISANSRYAPTSISQGTGLSSSPWYHVGGNERWW